MIVLLTGAGGFVGRHLIRQLLLRGHNLIAYDLRKPGLTDENNMMFVSGNLVEGENFDQIPWGDLDAIFHLAAAGVKAAHRNWPDCIAVNLLGTQRLLGTLSKLKRKAPRLFYTRTFYEHHVGAHPKLNDDPYVCTKAAAARLIKQAAADQEIPLTVSTIFQVYGPGDEGNVLSYVVQCLRTNTLALLGSGRGLRDWIHVEDVAGGLAAALENAHAPVEEYDLGTGKSISVREAAETLVHLAGKDSALLSFDPARDRNDTEIIGCAKQKVPGWTPVFNLREGLQTLLTGKWS